MRIDEKEAVIKIVRTAQTIDWKEAPAIQKTLLHFKQDKHFSKTIFGQRFLHRLNAMLSNTNTDNSCILCQKQEASNHVVCSSCIEGVAPAIPETQRIQPSVPKSMAASSAITKSRPISNTFIEELVRDLDSVMDKLATQRTVHSIYRLVSVIFVLAVINTCSIFVIALYLLGVFQ